MYRSCILAIMILFSFFKQSPKVKATLNVTQTICSFYKLYKKTNNNNNIVDNFHWTKTITSAQLTSSVSRDTFKNKRSINKHVNCHTSPHSPVSNSSRLQASHTQIGVTHENYISEGGGEM